MAKSFATESIMRSIMGFMSSATVMQFGNTVDVIAASSPQNHSWKSVHTMTPWQTTIFCLFPLAFLSTLPIRAAVMILLRVSFYVTVQIRYHLEMCCLYFDENYWYEIKGEPTKFDWSLHASLRSSWQICDKTLQLMETTHDLIWPIELGSRLRT